jgi:hypothetical protein
MNDLQAALAHLSSAQAMCWWCGISPHQFLHLLQPLYNSCRRAGTDLEDSAMVPLWRILPAGVRSVHHKGRPEMETSYNLDRRIANQLAGWVPTLEHRFYNISAGPDLLLPL